MLIYGTDLAFLKGKSVRKRPDSIKTIQQIPIPKTIFDHHQKNTSIHGLHACAKYSHATIPRRKI